MRIWRCKGIGDDVTKSCGGENCGKTEGREMKFRDMRPVAGGRGCTRQNIVVATYKHQRPNQAITRLRPQKKMCVIIHSPLLTR